MNRLNALLNEALDRVFNNPKSTLVGSASGIVLIGTAVLASPGHHPSWLITLVAVAMAITGWARKDKDKEN